MRVIYENVFPSIDMRCLFYSESSTGFIPSAAT
uniref:Uncharacterized protein n=1 Tax=Rhizophora mucronata TaxID=61149 RepID=A0A2P2NJ64_RHIMU